MADDPRPYQIEDPDNTRAAVIVEAICWGITIGFLLWVAWWTWEAKKVPW